jgi:tetratricopeptide (TPR) repeat protein
MFRALVAISMLMPLAAARACIWDSDTLADERKKSPDMAALILGTHQSASDTNALRKRIDALKAKPRESDPVWWNDLAGAHLRLGNAQEAANLLEPLRARFPDDYGIHANLGTAYHLLGRYADAEREIARDLELNTNAHFGLEVYHLALLQYLSRDKEYQARHAYVDEFTPALLQERQILHPFPLKGLAVSNLPPTLQEIRKIKETIAKLSSSNRLERGEYLLMLASSDAPAPYRFRWNLADNPNFAKGVGYMAELNSSQPACFVMLGLACLNAHDLNLAAKAFERAIALGSPQRQILEDRIAEISEHIREANEHRGPQMVPIAAGAILIAIVLVYVLYRRLRGPMARVQR